MRTLTLLLALCATAGCARGNGESDAGAPHAYVQATCASRAPSDAPLLTALRPDSAQVAAVLGAGVTLEVHGCGFAATDNELAFGPTLVPGIPSQQGGTVLRFQVPREFQGGGEVPPMATPAGVHEVTVRTQYGRSNALPLTLY